MTLTSTSTPADVAEKLPALAGDNRLPVLAAGIKREHEAVCTALKDSVHHAILAGELLIEAKAQFPHGQWLPWLRDHCGITERSAQRYMRIVRNKDKIKSDTVSDLTINGALALLTVPRETLDESLLDSCVDHLDAKEELARAFRSQAEIARRAVVFEKIDLDYKVMEAIVDRLGLRDRPRSICKEFDEIFDPLEADVKELVPIYRRAVERDDFDRSFAIAEWFAGLAAEWRQIAEEWAAKVEAAFEKPQTEGQAVGQAIDGRAA